ncbi:MAG TPA: hypothetical protein VK075_05575 [Pseudogracilibacillus sp.]|nr:hypothetical protein [Pseudogracilibacillus sp.]
MSFTNNQIASIKQAQAKQIIWKQVKLKWHVYQSAFLFIILAQLFGIILSYGQGSSMSVGYDEESNFIELAMTYFNGQSIIVLPIVGLFGLAFSLGLKQTKQMMATVVTTQAINVYSNVIFIIISSVLVGISSYLLSLIVKSIIFQYFTTSTTMVIAQVGGVDLIKGLFAAVLYTVLFSVIGYFLGELFTAYKWLFAIIILLFAGYLMTGLSFFEKMIINLHQFIFQEGSIGLFTAKVVGIVLLLFIFILVIVRRQEVR